MQLESTNFSDLIIAQNTPHIDDRGEFQRVFCADTFKDILDGRYIKQVNHSFNKVKGTVRGMHFQRPPHSEQKFVRCISGSIHDVVVDLRKGSPTFLQSYASVLSAINHRMICIPEGFAHGFQTLEDNCEILYFHTNFYVPHSEFGIPFDDPALNISWPYPVREISTRDMTFNIITSNFNGI
ncbi:dTDP-4-dehydrorhamnose 3,5-epimerase family protein [Amylibacter sp.]|nr:dTDP-4-dehydrorhamnose 3,5-epimerase family protein [Amylibacter sp.]